MQRNLSYNPNTLPFIKSIAESVYNFINDKQQDMLYIGSYPNNEEWRLQAIKYFQLYRLDIMQEIDGDNVKYSLKKTAKRDKLLISDMCRLRELFTHIQ